MSLRQCGSILLFLFLTFLSACSGGGSGGASAPATPPSEPPSQLGGEVIVDENSKTAAQGVTADWKIPNASFAANHEIEGYASATSVNRGESISLFVNTVDPEYTMTVYRIGWYGGQGARRVAGPITRKGVRQPAPLHSPVTDLIECDWTDPYVLNIPKNASDPTDWASGVYLVKLTGSSGKQSYIIFVVRDDERRSDILFQTGVTTYAAYNNWGGYDLYPAHSIGQKPAFKVSFNRPYSNPNRVSFGKGAGDFLDWELCMVHFLEREGFDVTYSTNIDTHRNGALLRNHRAVINAGHDEYWTWEMRDAFEAARDSGVNLGFFGANTSSWQIRMEPAVQTGQPDRTIVGYKYDAKRLDPYYKTNPRRTTYEWRETVDPPINRPEAALIGSMTNYNSVDLDMVIDNCIDWICEGTGLQKGSVLKGMLGYEVDRIESSSPPNVVALASSPYFACADAACTTGETRIANMTFYTAASGAGVFAAGSMNWNWGLDSAGQYSNRVNPAVQQITRNVLRRFAGK